jgi:hypothetical protein
MSSMKQFKRNGGAKNPPFSKQVEEKFPPQYSSQPVVSRTIRYKATGASVSVPITVGSLLNLIFGVPAAALATDFIPMWNAVKVNKIKIWGLNSAAATAFSDVALLWAGANTPDIEVTDSGTNNSPAHISSKPPKGSLASFWWNHTSVLTQALFNVTMPIGSILDINVSYVLFDGPTSNLTGAGVFTARQIAYSSLDSLTITNTHGPDNIQPLFLTFGALTSTT